MNFTSSWYQYSLSCPLSCVVINELLHSTVKEWVLASVRFSFAGWLDDNEAKKTKINEIKIWQKKKKTPHHFFSCPFKMKYWIYRLAMPVKMSGTSLSRPPCSSFTRQTLVSFSGSCAFLSTESDWTKRSCFGSETYAILLFLQGCGDSRDALSHVPEENSLFNRENIPDRTFRH